MGVVIALVKKIFQIQKRRALKFYSPIGGEELGGLVGRETIIRIYGMKMISFQLKKKKGKKWRVHLFWKPVPSAAHSVHIHHCIKNVHSSDSDQCWPFQK